MNHKTIWFEKSNKLETIVIKSAFNEQKYFIDIYKLLPSMEFSILK